MASSSSSAAAALTASDVKITHRPQRKNQFAFQNSFPSLEAVHEYHSKRKKRPVFVTRVNEASRTAKSALFDKQRHISATNQSVLVDRRMLEKTIADHKATQSTNNSIPCLIVYTTKKGGKGTYFAYDAGFVRFGTLLVLAKREKQTNRMVSTLLCSKISRIDVAVATPARVHLRYKYNFDSSQVPEREFTIPQAAKACKYIATLMRTVLHSARGKELNDTYQAEQALDDGAARLPQEGLDQAWELLCRVVAELWASQWSTWEHAYNKLRQVDAAEQLSTRVGSAPAVLELLNEYAGSNVAALCNDKTIRHTSCIVLPFEKAPSFVAEAKQYRAPSKAGGNPIYKQVQLRLGTLHIHVSRVTPALLMSFKKLTKPVASATPYIRQQLSHAYQFMTGIANERVGYPVDRDAIALYEVLMASGVIAELEKMFNAPVTFATAEDRARAAPSTSLLAVATRLPPCLRLTEHLKHANKRMVFSVLAGNFTITPHDKQAVFEQLKKAAPHSKTANEAFTYFEYIVKQNRFKPNSQAPFIGCATIQSKHEYAGRCPYHPTQYSSAQQQCAAECKVKLDQNTLFKGPWTIIKQLQKQHNARVPSMGSGGFASASQPQQRIRLPDAADPSPAVPIPYRDTEMQSVSSAKPERMVES